MKYKKLTNGNLNTIVTSSINVKNFGLIKEIILDIKEQAKKGKLETRCESYHPEFKMIKKIIPLLEKRGLKVEEITLADDRTKCLIISWG